VHIQRVNRSEARRAERRDWFPGTVFQQPLTDAPEDGRISAVAVWFDAGSRTRPHVHPVDQLLHVTEGTGVLATSDEKRIIRQGDWVVVPAGEWHWHGALPESAMCHVSIRLAGPTDWTSPWRDWEEYADGAE
jgi:quercetin dioxygenase-like cupin family protein